jgi:hypothetical protein
MQQHRTPQYLSYDANHSRTPIRPQHVQYVERCLSVFGQQRCSQAPDPGVATDVLYRGTKQIPASGLRLLMQRENMEIVYSSQPLDQPENTWNDPVLPAPIDATRKHQPYFHI